MPKELSKKLDSLKEEILNCSAKCKRLYQNLSVYPGTSEVVALLKEREKTYDEAHTAPLTNLMAKKASTESEEASTLFFKPDFDKFEESRQRSEEIWSTAEALSNHFKKLEKKKKADAKKCGVEQKCT